MRFKGNDTVASISLIMPHLEEEEEESKGEGKKEGKKPAKQEALT